MPLVWSREEFHQESRRLVSALQALREEKEFQDCQKLLVLCGWSMEAEGYLSHPPILRHVTAGLDSHDPDNKDDRDEEPFWDDSILQDDEQSRIISSASPSTVHSTTTTTTTKWHFSIVYSDTWKVPMLYFTVENMDQNGSPCPRSDVVRMLRQYSHYNRVADAWEFLSHEEHPITRVPSFFLHPCQTMQRMETLTQTPTKNSSNDNTANNQGLLLLSWMTMILPSVGYSVPSKVFQKLVVELRGTS